MVIYVLLKQTLDFYKNGEIKNNSYPNNFSLSFLEYINEYSRLIIPKISSDLYSVSINETIKDFDKEEDDEESDNFNLRFLTDKEKNKKRKKKNKKNFI